MSGLPRSIIKKYGVSKKAWRVYRNRKGRSRSRRRASKPRRSYRRRGYSMPRRRKKYGRRRSSGGKKFFGLSTKGLLIGGLGIAGVLGAAFMADQLGEMIPINLPGKPYLAAMAIGGPAGAVAKVGIDVVTGRGLQLGSLGGSSNGGGF